MHQNFGQLGKQTVNFASKIFVDASSPGQRGFNVGVSGFFRRYSFGLRHSVPGEQPPPVTQPPPLVTISNR
jgi:hypothetical protein